MKRFLLLLAITTLALSIVTGCGSDKKEGDSGLANVTAVDGGYVGTQTCLGCHDGSVAPDKTEFTKSGHPYKYTHTGGAVMGTSTLPGLYTRPATTTDFIRTLGLNSLWVTDGTGLLDWSAINFTVGGFGWKIRWGVRDTLMTGGTLSTGYVWSGPKTQYNIADGSWSAYAYTAPSGTYPEALQDKKYECAVCHNTNGIVSTTGYDCRTDGGTNAAPARTQPWAKNPGMGPETHGGYYSSWTFDGVQCEACHGPGQSHVGSSAKLNVLTLASGVEICAKCHIRAENTTTTGKNSECGGDSNPKFLTNGAVASGSWISHHEQYNELVGYNGDGVHAGLKCVTCHDPHKRAHKVVDSVSNLLGITDNHLSAEARGAIKISCVSMGCHGSKAVKTAAMQNAHSGLACIDCHMAEATKSAVGSAPTTTGAWGKKGDVKTHIFKINPAGTAITRTNADGKTIATNYLTPRYSCGKCHDAAINPATGTPMDEATAQAAATGYHQP